MAPEGLDLADRGRELGAAGGGGLLGRLRGPAGGRDGVREARRGRLGLAQLGLELGRAGRVVLRGVILLGDGAAELDDGGVGRVELGRLLGERRAERRGGLRVRRVGRAERRTGLGLDVGQPRGLLRESVLGGREGGGKGGDLVAGGRELAGGALARGPERPELEARELELLSEGGDLVCAGREGRAEGVALRLEEGGGTDCGRGLGGGLPLLGPCGVGGEL